MQESEKIYYCKGYKYQLRNDAYFITPINPEEDIKTELVELYKDGGLLIRKYFAWDGCSGPTWDDRTNTRACLIHDAFYFLMRMGLLPLKHRASVDDFLGTVMLKDGAPRARAEFYSWAVDFVGERNACPKNARKIYEAP